MKKKIVLFIEGDEHFRFIEPYLEVLKTKNFDLKIITLNNLKFNFENTLKINQKDIRKTFLNLNADAVITTTPGIGSYYFPKNKKRKTTYIYIFHSLVSPNEIYLNNSFKSFDIIFSPNDIISSQLKKLTKKDSKIYTVGYPLLVNNYYKKSPNSLKNSLLIAPSWGRESLLNHQLELTLLLNNLAKNSFDITLRPHPMELDKLNKIELPKNINIDSNKDLINLSSFKYLITDWSGIAIEFSLIKKFKSIFLDLPKKIRRKSKSETEHELIENKFRVNYGLVVKKDNFSKISKIIYEYNNWNIASDDYIRLLTSPEFDKFNISKILDSNL
tara:strand:- start:165 stop:1154 length:990 start_codon:yes stop_codon:yes gene_type:complete